MKNPTPKIEDLILKKKAWALVNLGMSGAEFDRLLPAQLKEYETAYRIREFNTDARVARIQYAIASASGCKNGDGSSVSLEQFMPRDPVTGKKVRLKKPRRARYNGKKEFAKFVYGLRANGAEIVKG